MHRGEEAELWADPEHSLALVTARPQSMSPPSSVTLSKMMYEKPVYPTIMDINRVRRLQHLVDVIMKRSSDQNDVIPGPAAYAWKRYLSCSSNKGTVTSSE